MNTVVGKWASFVVVSGMVLLTATGAVAKDEIEFQTEVDQARTILKGFQSIPEKGIPDAVLRNCKGLAFLTVLRAGFIISGSGGKGVVVAKNDDGTWTGPSFIGTGGAGFGFQIGAQVSEFVMVLNTPEAVQAFAKGTNVSVGAQVSAAAGPVGRSMGAEVMPQAAIYTYSRAQGLFGGVSLDGTVVATREEANTEYYGKKVAAKAILVGDVKAPAGADALRADLAKVTAAANAK
jgi:lipid-binding SYLF domain-containing protein